MQHRHRHDDADATSPDADAARWHASDAGGVTAAADSGLQSEPAARLKHLAAHPVKPAQHAELNRDDSDFIGRCADTNSAEFAGAGGRQ